MVREWHSRAQWHGQVILICCTGMVWLRLSMVVLYQHGVPVLSHYLGMVSACCGSALWVGFGFVFGDVFGNVVGVRSLAKRIAKALIPLDAPLRS